MIGNDDYEDMYSRIALLYPQYPDWVSSIDTRILSSHRKLYFLRVETMEADYNCRGKFKSGSFCAMQIVLSLDRTFGPIPDNLTT